MNPKHISISDYNYSLPEEKIAVHPLPERDQSKLLVYKSGKIFEDRYVNLPHFLPEKATIFFNDTRVIEARIDFYKTTGAKIEIFCLEPATSTGDMNSAMASGSPVKWKCLIGGASKWKPGQILEKRVFRNSGDLTVNARFTGKEEDGFIIELTWDDKAVSFCEMLHYAGAIPLPPYLHRAAEPEDSERYQTFYAKNSGSVAAPTAGLHFTPVVLEKLKHKSIQTNFVTLHVGAGTFKPVKTEKLEDHFMHTEVIEVSRMVIKKLAVNTEHPVFGVGTTTLRTLETLYWLGVKAAECMLNPEDDLMVEQWEPYTLPSFYAKETALGHLLNWMDTNNIRRLMARTKILIAPGYKIRTVNGLITNFHQPQSTLLLLIAAFIGNEWKTVYDYALNHDYRFLSYGDGCLLFRQEPDSSSVEVQL